MKLRDCHCGPFAQHLAHALAADSDEAAIFVNDAVHQGGYLNRNKYLFKFKLVLACESQGLAAMKLAGISPPQFVACLSVCLAHLRARAGEFNAVDQP